MNALDDVSPKIEGIYDVSSLQAHQAALSNDTPVTPTRSQSCVAWRYYIAALVFMSCCLINAQRLAISIAVVNMSNYTSSPQKNASSTSCPVVSESSSSPHEAMTECDFDWDPKLQGFILGSGFLGSAVVAMVAGPLADATGAKRIMLWGNVVSAVTMLVSPMVSWWHVYSLIFVHFVRGIAQGFVTTSDYVVKAKWTPLEERGFLSSFMITGYYTGSLLGGVISGYLCETPWLGWRAVFYFFGGVGALFSILFALTFYETPSEHPRISEAELRYITEGEVKNQELKKSRTPWFKMFTSIPTYALMYGLFGHYWAIFYLPSVHPLYLSTILHYPIKQNGLISSLPYLLNIIGALLSSSFSDWLYRRKYVGVDKLRKGCELVGCLGFSLSLMGIYIVQCNGNANILFQCTTLFFNGIGTPGSLIVAVDMTPNFSATLMGVVETSSTMAGFILPVMVGYMTKNQTLGEWQNVFLINIGVVMSSGLLFAIFGSAEVQPWNFVEDKTDTKKDKQSMERNHDTKKDKNVVGIKIHFLRD